MHFHTYIYENDKNDRYKSTLEQRFKQELFFHDDDVIIIFKGTDMGCQHTTTAWKGIHYDVDTIYMKYGCEHCNGIWWKIRRAFGGYR